LEKWTLDLLETKGTIINPMTTSEIIADFQRKQQKAIAEKGAEAGVNINEW
jgi:hypothetical protein